ncbi:hypothetical protein [Ignavibacterium album]|nr:hypothetical protein [Ignavibacterium album]
MILYIFYTFIAEGKVYNYDLAIDTWITKALNTVRGFSLSSEVYQTHLIL